LLAGLATALLDRRFDIDEPVAEGNSVVARFTGEAHDASGRKISFRGLTYYRLADGKIVEDDPITTPELAQEMAARDDTARLGGDARGSLFPGG